MVALCFSVFRFAGSVVLGLVLSEFFGNMALVRVEQQKCLIHEKTLSLEEHLLDEARNLALGLLLFAHRSREGPRKYDGEFTLTS